MKSYVSTCFCTALSITAVFVFTACTGDTPAKSNSNSSISSNANTPANQAVGSTGPNLDAPGTAQAVPPPVSGSTQPLPSGAVRPSAQSSVKPMPTVKMPEPQIGSGGSDFSLFTEIRSIILADKSMGEGVIIEVKEGSVTLSGSVSSEANRAKAASIAQSVKGVKTVKNNLRIGK